MADNDPAASAAPEKKPENTPDRKTFLVGGIVAGVMLLFAALSVVWFLGAQSRSSEGASIGTEDLKDGIKATGLITSVDPLKGEMLIKVTMEPVGAYDSNGQLAKPVTLSYSSPGGTKEIEFKAGKPLGAVDLLLPLEGDVSSYPWDHYTTSLEMAFAPTGDTGVAKKLVEAGGETTANGESAGDVPWNFSLFQQLPSYTVVKDNMDFDKNGVLVSSFDVDRAVPAVAFSVLCSIIMWCLALGVMFIALSIIFKRRKQELAAISLSGVILFAMPAALRSFQPGIPPPGVLADFYSFFWCDVIVAVALVALVVTYIRRRPE